MRPVRLALVIVGLVAPGLAATAAGDAMAQAAVTLGCGLEPGPTRAVAQVIDGETIRLDDGKLVRLVGALAPRREDAIVPAAGGTPPSEWPPETAARAALAGLVEGRSAALAFAGGRSDRHDRVLAHVFLAAPQGSGSEDVWVQGWLVEQGHARAYALPGSDACLAALVARERGARRAGRGLWGHAAYQVRPADRPSELQRYANTFQLVRGRVERASGTRSLAILELTSGERPASAMHGGQQGAFRVTWPRRRARDRGFERAEALIGANILVRGWIEARRGPGIEVVAGADIERED
jgi:endonuclease YncB( thermonuclease family)